MHITILTGAGFVRPLGLPTTTEFEIGQGEFVSLLKEFLKENNYNPKDIEHIFMATERFIDKDFTFYLTERFARSAEAINLVNKLRNLKVQAQSFSIELKKNIYRKLREFDDVSAFELYYNFLKLFNPKENTISFFTTNYDRTFERAYFFYPEKFTEIGIGRVEYHFSEQYGELVFSPKLEYRGFEYIKLHGSLDWYEEENRVVKTSAVVVPDDPEEVPLLYPGYKAMPDKEPFLSLHRIFLDRLLRSEFVIMVGFALRDEAINFLLDTALQQNKSLKVIFINPSKAHEFPPESDYSYFYSVYGERFAHICKRVEISDFPPGVSSLQELIELAEEKT